MSVFMSDTVKGYLVFKKSLRSYINDLEQSSYCNINTVRLSIFMIRSLLFCYGTLIFYFYTNSGFIKCYCLLLNSLYLNIFVCSMEVLLRIYSIAYVSCHTC